MHYNHFPGKEEVDGGVCLITQGGGGKKRTRVGCLTPQNKKSSLFSFWVDPRVVRYSRFNWTWCIHILLGGISVCQTLRPNLHICAIQPATSKHTHTSLCKPFFAHLSEENLSKSTNYSSGYTSPSTRCKQNDIGTHTPRSQENEAIFIIFCNVFIGLLLRSNSHKNTFFFFGSLYIPVKIYDTDLKPTGKQLWKCHQITTVDSYAPACKFCFGMRRRPRAPEDWWGPGNHHRPGGGRQEAGTGALPRPSPGLGVFAFAVLVAERVSDLDNFGCTQMPERFRVPLRHVAP